MLIALPRRSLPRGILGFVVMSAAILGGVMLWSTGGVSFLGEQGARGLQVESVGALPFIVFGLIWYINPKYIGTFFSDERLIVIGLGGFTWMGIGVFIMSKMVSFEI